MIKVENCKFFIAKLYGVILNILVLIAGIPLDVIKIAESTFFITKNSQKYLYKQLNFETGCFTNCSSYGVDFLVMC